MLDILKEAIAVTPKNLFLVVLGSSGSGKSHFIGTHPGKTLYIYGAGESHGPHAAIKNNPDIIAVAWDFEKNAAGETVPVPPNRQLARIKQLLDPDMLIAAGVECVALDSLTSLVQDIKATDLFTQRCTTAKGQHNAFKETEALIELTTTIIRQLQVLADFKGIDVITTLDLQIQSIADDGVILESKPSLPTFGVARALIQQFPDILVLGRVGIGREPKFQNCAKASTISTDRTTQTMVKYIEYNPRLRGVNEMPDLTDPTVEAIKALRGK